MANKVTLYTRPTLARQDAPFLRQGPARSARRRIRSLTFADGRELVSAQCLRGDAYSVPYVEPLSAVRTKLEGFFNSLLAELVRDRRSLIVPQHVEFDDLLILQLLQ